MLQWRFINLWISNCILTFANKNYLKLVPACARRTIALVPVPGPFPGPPSWPFLRVPCHWRFGLIEAPACTEHFKYLQRYFKKRFWHVLFLYPVPFIIVVAVLLPVVGLFVCVCPEVLWVFPPCWSSVLLTFRSLGRKRENELQMWHEGGSWVCVCVRVCECVFVGGALEGACVLLGKCQKPLVKKPYGNYSTQLNMKCGDGKGEHVGRKTKKIAALGK